MRADVFDNVDRLPDVAGLACRSRLDGDEWCWAIWDYIEVEICIDPLEAEHRHHRRAVKHAARLLEIQIPSDWR